MQRRDFLRTGAQAALAAGAMQGAMQTAAQRAGLLGGLPASWTAFAPADPIATMRDDRMQWWRDARFGMFVHWGLYAILAGEWGSKTHYGEWIRTNAKIPVDEYEKLLSRWQPNAFDADALARLAQRAGMRYLVITTKHHDGFALFPSKHGAWNVSRASDQRDMMKEVSDACRRHGIVPCWYHSIMDWHHNDYLPRRDWEAPERPINGASFTRYVDFLHAQVEELLTNYGDIGVMWFDGEWESTWTHELGAALMDKCRALQPNVIVNNRVAPNRGGMEDARTGTVGDFGTPEQNIPAKGLPGVDWESCITMNQNWGYNRVDKDFKSVAQLVSMLVDTSSKGGNLLLNVGPMASGDVPPESVDRLQGLARWMDRHGDAIHATQASPFDNTSYRATRSAANDRINAFFSVWPSDREVLFPGLRALPARATLMGAGAMPLPMQKVDRGVVVTIPEKPSDPVCSVLRLESSVSMRVG